MTLLLSQICERIYATTALATISPKSDAVLLHPDHEPALKSVIRDVMAAIVATLPKENVAGFNADDEKVEIILADRQADNDATKAALMTAAATLALAQVKIAASGTPSDIVRLASVLPVVTQGISGLLEPTVNSRRIVPFP